MSKTTKIVAALGIVAGLGVAALPAFTYATQEQQEIYGDVDVIVEVQPAIAMVIEGNNDDGRYYDEKVSGYNKVESFAPSGIGGKTLDGYTLPATSIDGTSSSYVSLLPNAYGNTKSTVSIYTNSDSGYTLGVRAKTDAALTQIVEPGVTADTIAAIDGTPAVRTPGWAFKVANVDGKTNVGTITTGYTSDKQMTTADQNIVTSTGKTSGGDSFDVTYDVATKADQATGIYKTTLVYTASTI